MIKILKYKKMFATVALFLLCFGVLFMALPTGFAFATDSGNKFDKINVLDDLQSSDGFDIKKYPFDSTGLIKSPEIMNVVEYCYSFKVNMQSNYGLYLYFYNPQQLDIAENSKSNKVQMAVSYKVNSQGDVVPNEYEKFDLEFCSVSTETNFYKLFYKFKVVDHKGKDGKLMLQRLNSNERRYDISGVELSTKGSTNSADYGVGGSYFFTGYAKGYGADQNAESNLNCTVKKLETIKLDLTGAEDGIDKRTYWRSNSSSLGAHHQNQLNSVFFSIDKNVLEKYGYMLQKIKAEWWEEKTVPAVVIDDIAVFNKLLPYVGVPLVAGAGGNGFNSNVPYLQTTTKRSTTDHPGQSSYTYNWSYNTMIGGLFDAVYYTNYAEKMLPLLFYTGGINANNYTLLPDVLQKHCETYDKSFEKGVIEMGNHSFSADLFANNVDNGRIKGYNLRQFDISNPNDLWDLKSYDTTHNWWDKFKDYGFGKITTNDDFNNVLPIQMIKPEDMFVSDLSTHLKINADDVGDFKKFYNSVKKDSEVFIFRYAQTDYYAEDLTEDLGTAYKPKVCGEVRQGTHFFDFDILEFTFNKDGEYTVIPVVSSPIDHWSGYTPSIEPTKPDWWKIILAILALVLFLIIFMPLLPFIIQIVVYVITIPFRLLSALFKGVGGSSKTKKYKQRK